jgi:hypothetical protein
VIVVVAARIAIALMSCASGLRSLAARGSVGVDTRSLVLIITGQAFWPLFKMLSRVEWLTERLGGTVREMQMRDRRE